MNEHDQVVADTVAWLERAVIGLNLCPFAKSVHVKGQVHYAVSQATTPQLLLADLIQELNALVALDSKARDTTLLIVPQGFEDFLDFNDFLADADQALVDLDLDGVLQIASLHPRYQFAGTLPDDVTNCTNRSPYPTLHLLREDSIDRAVAAFPNPETIFEANMQTMERLGLDGWAALNLAAHVFEASGVASSGDEKQNR
ncbi:MAG: peptidase [Comamonadaceae bacterium CG2_30_57_122]|nr:MAG: peptidase [Comamonadaceae bacterium CG2_30_57_122]